MRDDVYKLAGTVSIPEDKKAEFNRYILQILEKCGIRKTERIALGGQMITVVRHPIPDEGNIVHFDYSIFEKKKRKTSFYNMNTCELMARDRGYNEFGVVMNMIMVMQESYSEERCYFMCEDKPCSVETYALMIREVLGISLKFPRRSEMWDMLLFFKNTREYHSVTSEMIWNSFSSGFCNFIPEQFFAAFSVDSEVTKDLKKSFKGKDSGIEETPQEKILYYVYQNMIKCIEKNGREFLEDFLRKLLDADLQKRQKLTEDMKYGTIAAVSLYVLPPVIVLGYALAVQQDFWDVWKKLGIKGYSEIIAENNKEKIDTCKEDKRSFPFYKAIRRDYEDEFIEFWKDGSPCFSDDMKKCLSDWRSDFTEISLEESFDMEASLTQIVTELDQYCGCRLADQEFITEFLKHREDDNYKRALLLYKKFIDKNLQHFLIQARLPVHAEMSGGYFWEWIKKKTIRRAIRNNRYQFELIAMSAFQSLLINHRRRYEILGF